MINLAKYRTAIAATECVHEAILQLGGNGTIETFSILPRLYRDSLITETWEGPHNTLALQIARDSTRFPLQGYLEEHFRRGDEALLGRLGLPQAAEWLKQETSTTLRLLPQLKDSEWVLSHARRWMDRLGILLEISLFSRLGEDRKGLVETYLGVVSHARSNSLELLTNSSGHPTQ